MNDDFAIILFFRIQNRKNHVCKISKLCCELNFRKKYQRFQSFCNKGTLNRGDRKSFGGFLFRSPNAS